MYTHLHGARLFDDVFHVNALRPDNARMEAIGRVEVCAQSHAD